MTQGPVLIDLEGEAAETPSSAPPVPELEEPPSGQTMQTLATLAARRPSRLGRFFWTSLLALVGFAASVAAWDFVTGLLARNAVIGTVALVLLAAEFLRSRHQGSAEMPFAIELAFVSGTVIALAVAYWAALGIFAVPHPGLDELLMQAIFTLMAYPVVAGLSRLAFNIRRLSPGETETGALR